MSEDIPFSKYCARPLVFICHRRTRTDLHNPLLSFDKRLQAGVTDSQLRIFSL